MRDFLKKNHKVIVTSVLFQLGWFACIFAPIWLYLPYALVFFISYFFVVTRDSAYWLYGIKLAVVGCLIDSFLIRTGVIQVESNIIPLWLVVIWVMFSFSVPYAFGFLRNKYLLASCLGAVGATTSYMAGIRLRDDVDWLSPAWQGMLIIALVWSIIMPYAFFQLRRVENALR